MLAARGVGGKDTDDSLLATAVSHTGVACQLQCRVAGAITEVC